MTFKSTSLAATILLLGLAPASAAGANRTFVSGKGSDTNPCTIAAPCRSLQAAVNATAPAGELVILDPAGYGTVTISQSITIANDGVGTASISVPSQTDGIIINAGASDTVQLRGLEIDGNNVGFIGIYVTTVGTLSVVNCVVRHLQMGVFSNSGNTAVSNSIVSDQYGYQSGDPYIGDAIVVNGNNAIVSISNALLSGNTNNAIYALGGAVAIVDRDTILYNRVGLYNGGGVIDSYQNSNIKFNTTADTSGTITPVTPK